jgi:hypothetical protein
LLNKDRVEAAFYKRFFPLRSLIQDLEVGIERFRTVALLRYGNFVHAYRKLSRIKTDDALREELGELLIESEDKPETKCFIGRSAKLINVEPILRSDTPLVGYLSIGQLDSEEKAAQVLSAASKKPEHAFDWQTYVDIVARSVKEPLKATASSVISAFQRRRPNATISDFSEFISGALPVIRHRAEKGIDVQRIAENNQNIYLTWDHMDVYFATSMRKPWEFYDLYDFINGLMVRPELADLRLRYFDPTQCFTKLPVDKGLVECLMLKRAKCTVYSVQDTDTLGKDSELAATLAQGKPVIAFIPEIDIKERAIRLASDDPSAILERLRFVLYVDEGFAQNTNPADYSFVAQYTALHDFARCLPFRSIPDESWAGFRSAEQGNLERLCTIIAHSEKRIYDKRANTLKHRHPLALQVSLDTGVANGVLVVRSLEQCARLLRSVLTHTMDLALTEENGMWCLRENISGSIFRVATKNKKIDNCFWNFYLRDASIHRENT